MALLNTDCSQFRQICSVRVLSHILLLVDQPSKEFHQILDPFFVSLNGTNIPSTVTIHGILGHLFHPIPPLTVFATPRTPSMRERLHVSLSTDDVSNHTSETFVQETGPYGEYHRRKGMELVPEGRNFRLAQKEELPNILNFLEKYLPESLKFHQTIKTYLNDFVWEFYFYIPRSWPDDPICLHFPGMTSSPNGLLYESFSVFCPTSNLDLLSLVEEEDILLDWSKPIYINFTHIDITDRLEAFYEKIGTVDKVVGDVYMSLEPQTDDQTENSQEEGFEIRQLIKEDVQTIHELYPANDMEAVGVFEKLILQLPAYGVFCKGELAAWMVQSYYGAMFSMQTRPEFRRRGYGILLARKLMNLVVERGYIPYVVIRPENEASKSLYSKLGFQRIYQTVRAVFKPFTSGEDVSYNDCIDEVTKSLSNI